MKKIIIGLLFFGSVFPVWANEELKYTCKAANNNLVKCQCNSNKRPLFSIDDIKPGYNFYEKISLSNKSPNNECSLYFKTDKIMDFFGLSRKLSLELSKEDGSKIYQGTVFGSATGNPIFIDTLGKGSSAAYNWKLSMDKEAGNFYQNKTTKFEMDIIFQCIPKDKTPLPIPTHSPLLDCFLGWRRGTFSQRDFVWCVLGRK